MNIKVTGSGGVTAGGGLAATTGGGQMSMSQKPWTTKDPPLIQMVEEYLSLNRKLSYVNVEDMIDSLKNRSFRYSRMKRGVFAEMVRKAYTTYCARPQFNSGVAVPLKPGAGEEDDIVISDPNELEEETSTGSDSDSDVQIQEDYQTKQDLPNSILTNLYSANNGATATTSQNTGIAIGDNQIASVTVAEKSDVTKLPPFPTIRSSTGGEHDSESATRPKVSSTTLQTEEQAQTSSNWNSNEVGYDSDDLEIVDEVQGLGVISNSNGTVPDELRNLVSISCVSISNTSTSNLVTNQTINSSNILSGTVLSSKHPSGGNMLQRAMNAQMGAKLGRNGKEEFRTEKQNKEIPNLQQLKASKRKLSKVESQDIDQDLSPKKKKKEVNIVKDSGYKLCDFAGSEKVVEEICRLLMHLKHPEVYKTLGVTAPRGFLLHGPPGTGKTLLANAIAGELQLPMLKATATEFISGISGESESNIRDLFNQAIAVAPCIIFIDEIDSITPKRENASKEMERRVVAQLLSCVDELMNHEKGDQILLIGATNRIEAIDVALRRAGRFDREICLGIPDEMSREKILKVICRKLRLAADFDFGLLAKITPGYVGADLLALVREAAVQAVQKALLKSDKECLSSPLPSVLAGNNANVINSTESTDKIKQTSEAIKVIDLDETVKVDQSSEAQMKVIDLDETMKVDQSSEAQMKVIDLDEAMKVDQSSEAQMKVIDLDEAMKVDQSSEAQMKVIDLEETMKVIDLDETDEKQEPTLEKMEVDVPTEAVSAAENAQHITNSGTKTVEEVTRGTSAEDVNAGNALKPSGVNEEIKNRKPLYLRWIQEFAPLPQNELDKLYLFMEDFKVALKFVQPSSKREGFATVPDTTWDDIGALKEIREELEVSILGPVKHSVAFEALGLNTPAGVLLCGPPGCGKTLLAKAVANEAGINFISVKGPELLNMYVGESERAVRQCFLRAKNSSPCVIFFDELDALCPRRSENSESGSGSRIVNQLLTEMDGIESRTGVFVMAATNRPDIIDPAVLRPGRLDKILFVDLPNASDRLDILKAITKEGTVPVLADNVHLQDIASNPSCENYTGADLASLVREASIAAFRDLVLGKDAKSEWKREDLKVSAHHFSTAFSKTKPSVTKKDREKYAEMKERYSTVNMR